MALPRQKFRELVFQLLFAKEFNLAKETEIVAYMMKHLKTGRSQIEKGLVLVDEILEKQSFIDGLIEKHSKEYKLSRISKAELVVLRLSIYELFFLKDIPIKVSFAEAIRLCRKFGSEDSSNYANGLLDTILKENVDDIKNSKK